MGWPYLIFKGVNTQTIGLHVTQMPSHKRAGMRTTSYNLPGRDGELHVNEGYAAYDMQVRISAWNATAYIRQIISAWADGTGKLISSDDLTKCWKASVVREVSYERRIDGSGKFYDEATVTFRCQPYMYESTESTQGAGTLVNPGTADALPEITAVFSGAGTGTVTIAGQSMSITTNKAGTVKIDTEAGYLWSDTTGMNATMTGVFPVIPLGNSTATASGCTVTIKPRWRWI